MTSNGSTIRIAAVADLHVKVSHHGKWRDLFAIISKRADVLLLGGDLTNNGEVEEAETLVAELKTCSIPVVSVLGNHDYESSQEEKIIDILKNRNVHLLSGSGVVIKGIGIAGTKGFGGGFGPYKLMGFGEDAMKIFVKESERESNLLNDALGSLDAEYGPIPKIALLHYAPIPETVTGEPKEIFPFMGSSRLIEPLLHHRVIATFHGHAHSGQLEATVSGVKVINVALPVLAREGLEPTCYFFNPHI